MLTTAGEHSFTSATIGLVPSLITIFPAAMAAVAAINAKTAAKPANTFIRLVIASTSMIFIYRLTLL
jgi:hypothetical protein